VVLLWVATGRAIYLLLGTGMFVGGATVAYQAFDHVRERVSTWRNPWPEYRFAGNQVLESWFALADGGVTGSGLGLGTPTRIPVVETDFIFAAIGEELGLLGTTAILISFLLLIGTGLRIAVRADEPFEKLLATGLTTLLGLQAFVIIAGTTRLLPLTGVTLPFVSYGGSSLLGNYILLALLVRISDDGAKRRGEVAPTPRTARRGAP
jgi:cell division protein FtsW (lipid II flippase)